MSSKAADAATCSLWILKVWHHHHHHIRLFDRTHLHIKDQTSSIHAYLLE